MWKVRLVLAGSHPDLLVVGTDPERATRVVSVDQAHTILNLMQLQRHSARRRFVIIDPADAMNDESANTLLKTLEEPPAGAQFNCAGGAVVVNDSQSLPAGAA